MTMMDSASDYQTVRQMTIWWNKWRLVKELPITITWLKRMTIFFCNFLFPFFVIFQWKKPSLKLHRKEILFRVKKKILDNVTERSIKCQFNTKKKKKYVIKREREKNSFLLCDEKLRYPKIHSRFFLFVFSKTEKKSWCFKAKVICERALVSDGNNS
jgi:hypothetical protein